MWREGSVTNGEFMDSAVTQTGQHVPGVPQWGLGTHLRALAQSLPPNQAANQQQLQPCYGGRVLMCSSLPFIAVYKLQSYTDPTVCERTEAIPPFRNF